MEKKKLFLLDAYALIFRAYHAMKYSPRFTSKGLNTSAIFGFVNTLEEILKKENPSHIAVCFDPAGKTFRHEMYPEYKAGREATPEDIKKAIPYIKDIIRAYRIPIIEVPGYEADDVIGTLAVKSREKDYDTFIMSPDKDLCQLVDETVKVYRPGYKGAPAEIRDIEAIKEVFGVDKPIQVIDILALMGDKADNILGCPGVGEKTASKLVLEFGSVEELVANTDKLKGSVKNKVESNVESILFSKKLATICTDVPIEINEEQLSRKEIDADEIRRIFAELEFKTLLNRVLGTQTAMAEPSREKAKPKAIDGQLSLFDDLLEPNPEIETLNTKVEGNYIIVDESHLSTMVDKALACKEIGVTVVTSVGEAMKADLAGVAVATDENEGFYIAMPDEESIDVALPELNRLLGDDKVLKIGADLKHSMIVLKRYGVPFSEPYYDNSVAHYLLQPEMSHSLQRLVEIYLQEQIPEPVMPEGVKASKFDPAFDCSIEEMSNVACASASANLRLRGLFDKMLADNEMSHLLYDIELPLIAVLADMEMAGVRFDVKTLNEYSVVLTKRLDEIEAECMELAGMKFNVASPVQVGEVLFDHLKIDAKAKKTSSGKYSTAEEELEKLRDRHPLVGKVLEFRKIKKLLSTYVNALPELINPTTGKIHTTYNQTVTATGRLSSTNPNLQNLPIRNEEGREIRRAVIPDEGHIFFSADYSQIELRIVANISKDPTMVEAFLGGEDIHKATAAKIFHEKIADVTEDQRRKAKTANFGMIYGISAFGLSQRLSIPRSEAKEIIDGYFVTFPGVRKFMDESIEHSREKGYVTTLFGRRRILPDIASRNAVVRGYAERNAINAPIQGTAADIIKIAMIRIFKRFNAEGIKSKMIMQVHDELNFDVYPDELEKVQTIVKEEMEGAFKATVPLIADCGTGHNWLEAH